MPRPASGPGWRHGLLGSLKHAHDRKDAQVRERSGWRHGLPGSPACLECEGRQQCRPFLAAPLLAARRSNRMAWRMRSNVPLIVQPGSGSGRASQMGEMVLAHAQSAHRPTTGKDRPAPAPRATSSRPPSAGTNGHGAERRWRRKIFFGQAEPFAVPLVISLSKVVQKTAADKSASSTVKGVGGVLHSAPGAAGARPATMLLFPLPASLFAGVLQPVRGLPCFCDRRTGSRSVSRISGHHLFGPETR